MQADQALNTAARLRPLSFSSLNLHGAARVPAAICWLIAVCCNYVFILLIVMQQLHLSVCRLPCSCNLSLLIAMQLQLGKVEAARDAFEAAVLSNGLHAETYNNLGILHQVSAYTELPQ